MMVAKEVNLVTGNEKKWEEIRKILGDSIRLNRVNVDVPEIQGSIEEIAKHKCAEAARLIKGATITEDSALCFDDLNGLPGPYIKWFLNALGLEGLNKMLDGFNNDTGNGRRGRAVCTFAYCPGPGEEPILFQGVTEGFIVRQRGPLNFGWDPIFQPDDPSGKTYAEMPQSYKNSMSHRFKALTLLRNYLETQAQPQ